MKTLHRIIFSCAVLLTALSCSKQETGTPKYVFLLIGDGMSINAISATENYMAFQEGKHYMGPRLRMRTLPVMGMVDTYAANNCVTCSAAAGTAIACGQKTKCGYEGMDTAGNAINSIASILHDRGYRVGILTNEPVNHATPAAFYGHVKKRSYYDVLSRQLPESGFELFGGDGFIQDEDDTTGFDPVAYAAEKGYSICYGPAAMDGCAADSKVCLFQPSSRLAASTITAAADENKTYDIEADAAEDMTLECMLEAAIEHFGDDKPFFIMCEGGDIDHAAHNNFTMCAIHEIMELDKALGRALEFYEAHPDETLILVTSDHETGGMCLGGPRIGKWVDWAALEEDYGQNPTRSSSEAKLCREISKNANIGWYTLHHSGGNAPVFAIGVHAERFSNAMDNTEFVEKIL